MKKKFVSLVCSLALAASLVPSISSGATTNDVLKAASAPSIDGKSDAAWNNAIEYKMGNYIVAVHDNDGDHGAPRLDPTKEASDFSGTWKALWDDQNFYLLIDIKDQKRIGWNMEFTRGRPEYDDAVLYYLTPAVKTPYTTSIWHPKSNSMEGWWGPPDFKDDMDTSKIKWAINDYGTGYTVEAAIPWSIVGTTPKANMSMLFDAIAVDNDLGGDYPASNGVNGRYPQSKLTWNDKTGKSWEDQTKLGTIVLRGETKASAPAAPAPAPTTPNAPSTPATPAPAPAAGNGVNLYINGVNKTADAAPVIVNNRTMVPLRMIFETLGASVEWVQATQTVNAKKGDTSISLQIGSSTAKKDGKSITLDAAPQLIDNKTMVPLRFVSEALGAEVKWDGDTRTVSITSK